MGHTGQFKDRAQRSGIHNPHRLSEGTLFLQVRGGDDAFKNNLGAGRNLQIHGLALDQLNRLSYQTAR